MHKMKASQLK